MCLKTLFKSLIIYKNVSGSKNVRLDAFLAFPKSLLLSSKNAPNSNYVENSCIAFASSEKREKGNLCSYTHSQQNSSASHFYIFHFFLTIGENC